MILERKMSLWTVLRRGRISENQARCRSCYCDIIIPGLYCWFMMPRCKSRSSSTEKEERTRKACFSSQSGWTIVFYSCASHLNCQLLFPRRWMEKSWWQSLPDTARHLQPCLWRRFSGWDYREFWSVEKGMPVFNCYDSESWSANNLLRHVWSCGIITAKWRTGPCKRLKMPMLPNTV